MHLRKKNEFTNMLESKEFRHGDEDSSLYNNLLINIMFSATSNKMTTLAQLSLLHVSFFAFFLVLI